MQARKTHCEECIKYLKCFEKLFGNLLTTRHSEAARLAYKTGLKSSN